MRIKFIVNILFFGGLFFATHWGWPYLHHKFQLSKAPVEVPPKEEIQSNQSVPPSPAPPKPVEEKKIVLREVPFSELPDWGKSDPIVSLKTFKVSCRVFLKQDPEREVGSEYLPLKAKNWYPACQEAVNLDVDSSIKARLFFQKWFRPVEFYDGEPLKGLFTGYYLPTLNASLVKTAQYNVPLYGVPKDLVTARLRDFNREYPNRTLVGRLLQGKLVPYYTRKAITEGAVTHKAPVVAWIKSSVDRLFLEIEGSGVLKLTNGQKVYVGYAAQNGAPYTPIARVLIEQGVMTKDNASMQRIRRYFAKNPDKVEPVLNQNQSFVFFRRLQQKGALGAQGTILTDGYSLAVDRDYVPLGTPIWLSTRRPDVKLEKTHPFKRLMIAQDTGGAIRGPVRGDIFWGSSERATAIAGKMKDPGRYWLLLPKTVSLPVTY